MSKITAKRLAAAEASRTILAEAEDLLIKAGLSDHFACTYDDVVCEVIFTPTSRRGQLILADAGGDLARIGAREITLDS